MTTLFFIVTISIIAGYVIGFIVTKNKYDTKSVGVLKIDNSDPEDGPYLFLELNAGQNPRQSAFQALKKVSFDVEVGSYLSQK